MKIQKILGFMVIMAAFAAQAQQEVGSTRGYLTNAASTDRWAGWAPFAGLNAGYMAENTDANAEVEGVPASVKILGSYVVPSMNYVFDGGVGYTNQTFSSDNAADRNVGTAIGELAARYQWQNRWQAGVVWNTIFNKGEAYGANQGDAQFAGLQALKEFPLTDEWMMRAGGRYMTDVNVDGAYLNAVMVDVEFGYNPWSSRRGVRQTAAAEQAKPAAQPGWKEGPAMTGQPMPVSDRYGTEELWARRDFLLFDVSSATLDADDTGRLERLAAAINENPDIVGQIEVVGYADPSGSEQMNKKLSKHRAESVKQNLIDKGIPAEKITVVARGEAAPLSTYEKSRRAELHFQDVKDPEALKRVVNAVH